MKLTRTPLSFHLIASLATAGLALGACQTPPPSTPSETAKPVDAPKPITPEYTRNVANNCFTCHGPGGKSPGAIPSLNLLGAERIAAKLKGFKSGAEASTVMGRHARAYSDAEIEAVANYIAGLKK